MEIDRQDLSKFNWDSWMDIDDGSYDVFGTEEDEPKKWGVWHIYTRELKGTCDTKEEAEMLMDEYQEKDYEENGYTAIAYEVREV